MPTTRWMMQSRQRRTWRHSAALNAKLFGALEKLATRNQLCCSYRGLTDSDLLLAARAAEWLRRGQRHNHRSARLELELLDKLLR